MSHANYAVLIAEDMLIQRQLILQYCQRSGLNVVGETGSGQRLVELALELKPDIVLLDIDLNQMSGIEAYRRISQAGLSPQVIFTTGSQDPAHILTGINEIGSVAYLTKPVRYPDFATAVQRAIRNLRNEQMLQSVNIDAVHWIKAAYQRREFTLNEDSIIYIEKSDKRTLNITLTNGNMHRVTSPLKDIEQQSSGMLFSPHRAFLANIRHIMNVVPDPATAGNYLLIMRNDATVPLTRRQFSIYAERRDQFHPKT